MENHSCNNYPVETPKPWSRIHQHCEEYNKYMNSGDKKGKTNGVMFKFTIKQISYD